MLGSLVFSVRVRGAPFLPVRMGTMRLSSLQAQHGSTVGGQDTFRRRWAQSTGQLLLPDQHGANYRTCAVQWVAQHAAKSPYSLKHVAASGDWFELLACAPMPSLSSHYWLLGLLQWCTSAMKTATSVYVNDVQTTRCDVRALWLCRS